MIGEATLRIPALHCGSCVKTVTRTVEALPSVQVTDSDATSKTVRLQFDESAITLDQIRETLDQVGFSPEE